MTEAENSKESQHIPGERNFMKFTRITTGTITAAVG
jgi:hypothetical protein